MSDIPQDMTPEKLRKLADVLDTYETLLQQYFTRLKEEHRIMPFEHDHAMTILGHDGVQTDIRRWADEIEAA